MLKINIPEVSPQEGAPKLKIKKANGKKKIKETETRSNGKGDPI